MTWPHSQDYNEAIQNPRHNLSDPELREGEAVTNALGLPVPRSGNFADVYEFRCPRSQGHFALKCFTREVPGLQERYSEISRHLQNARLPFTVEFQYQAEGIRIGNRWFPLLKMQWVEGLLLNEFVRSTLDRPATLEALMQIWARMSRRLGEAAVTHGDLQHGNVLLVPGSKTTSLAVKLIDYDGMFVPALANVPSREVGHPAYQHPQRLREGTYNGDMDRFSLLIVAAALRCVMVGGRSLWDRYDNGDNLLFRETDLKAPGQSALFRELFLLEDPLAHALVGQLAQGSLERLDQVPRLEELLADGSSQALTAAQEREVAALLGVPFRVPVAAPVFPSVAPSVDSSAAPVASPFSPPPPESSFDFTAATPGAAARVRRRQLQQRQLVWAGAGGALLVAVIALVVVIIALGRRTPSPRPEVVVQATLPESKDTPVSREDTAPKSTKTTKETRPAQPVPPPGPVTELAGHAGGTLAIACSSDGTLVLTGGADGMVRLWDARTGQELFRCEGHKGPVTGVALASNDRLVSGSQDRTVRIWDRWGGKLMFTVTDYPGPVRSLAVSQKEDRLLTAGWGTEVWLQDLGRAQGIPFGHSVPVTCVAFSPDGKSFLAGTDSGSGPDDNAVVLWNIEKRTQVWRGRGHTRPVRSVAFSADGSRAVSASDDRTVRIWSVEKGTEVQCLEGHRTAVVGAAFTPEQLVVSAGGPSVIVWDPVTETDVRHVEVPNREAAQLAIAFPGSKVFLADRRAAPVVLLELPPRDQLVKSAPEPVGEVRRYTSHTAEVRRLAVSPRGRTLLAASRDGLIHVYNVRTGQEVRQLKGHTGPVNAVAFCPDGTQVLSGGQDGTARLWDLETGKELQQLKDLEEVLSIAVSPDGEQAAVAGVGSAVVLWDLVEDEEIRQLEHTGGVNCVRYSSEGNRLVSAGTNRVLHLWDPDTGQNLASFKGHLGRIYSAAFSPNGQMLLSGGEDATVRLWDVGSAKEVRRFHGANGSVYAVAFSADGSLALAAGTDREIFLWETGKGQAAPPLQGHKGLIWDAVFSPDGRYAYSAGGGEDTSVRRWHLPPRTEYVVVPIEKPPIRLPVPAEEVRKAAIANVQEKYRTHVKHTRQSDLDLAGRVLQAGLNATGDPEYQYALLHQARFVYARCGMVTEALQAVEELGKVFQIDSLEERTITLELLSNASSAEPGTPRALVDRALVEFEEALAADEYKIADRLLDVAEKMVRTIARTTAYTNYNKQVRDRRDRLEPLLKEYPAIKQALDTLAANKEDAPANLKLGQFYCFHKQDWSKGIPHLARGSDTVLSALAGKELVPPKTGPDMLQVADGWSKQAESVPEPIRLTLQKRAYHWYLRALSDLTGAEENRAESRIDALGKQVPGLKTRWDFYDIGPLDPTLDPLRLKAGQEIATRHCYQGPIEITTVVERPSLKSGSCGLQLSAFRSLSVVFLWTAKGGEVRVSRPDKEHPQGVQVFRKEEIPVKGKFRSQLCWRIGEDNMDLLFDGAPIYSEKGEKLDLSTRHPVRLGVKEGALGVKSLSVISKSKPASKE